MIQAIQSNPWLFYSLVAFTGLFVGSFLNVVIHRLPIMMENEWRESLAELDDGQALPAGDTVTETPARFNLSVPRSRCPGCGALIHAWQNIPVVSWLMLRGKCASCQARISARYPIIEALTMVLSLMVAWHFGPGPQALLGIVATWFLVAMSMIDFDTQLLPDSLTLPLLWIGLLASLMPVFAEVREAVLGAAVGYGILWCVFHAFKLITGKEGMGYGDFKLLAAIGALLGWQVLPMVILLSSLVGAVVGLSLIAITGRDKNIPIPFGPYLAAAGWLAMLYGDWLNERYLALLA